MMSTTIPSSIIHDQHSKDALGLLKSLESDSAVAKLDPLGLNETITRELVEYNQKELTTKLIKYAEWSCGKLEKSSSTLSIFDAQAALRDLGLIAASLTRFGVKITEVRSLSESLIFLSGKTDEVPRDTVFSYGPRNPMGGLMRTFTNSPEEREFINSFRVAMTAVTQALVCLYSAFQIDINHPQFSQIVDLANNYCKVMINSIVAVIRAISPEYFTGVLRPFFEPILINGKIYYAPGGAQMQLLLIDRLLWGASELSSMYQSYYSENIYYLPPEFRIVSNKIGETSLVETMLLKTGASISNRTNVVKSFISVKNVLLTILKFRHPHLRLAKNNFALRHPDTLGSGGYNIDVLVELIDLNRLWVEKIDSMLSKDLFLEESR